jgi:hypothetical protein
MRQLQVNGTPHWRCVNAMVIIMAIIVRISIAQISTKHWGPLIAVAMACVCKVNVFVPQDGGRLLELLV